MRSIAFTRRALAAALCLLPVFASQAATDPVLLQANVRLEDLRFRLVDLDTTDGVTPWVDFGEAARGHVWAAGTSEIISGDQPWMFTPGKAEFTDASGDARVGKNGDVITASLALRRSDAQALSPRSPDDAAARAAFFGTGLDHGQGSLMMLSANTAVIVEGMATTSVHIDLAALDKADTGQIAWRASARASFGTGFVSMIDTHEFESPFYSSLSTHRVIQGADGRFQIAAHEGNVVNQTFSARFDNRSGTSHPVYFYLNAIAQNQLFAAPVPEPSTWALALAGLLVAGVLRRRTEH